jgi:uncharacterized membrane protein YiaA
VKNVEENYDIRADGGIFIVGKFLINLYSKTHKFTENGNFFGIILMKLVIKDSFDIIERLWIFSSVQFKRIQFKINLTSILCQLGLLDDPIQLIHNS